MKKILITGASGFIGGFLVKEALNRGYETWAGVRSTSSRVNLQDERIRFIDLKYSDRESLTAQLADFVREHGPWDYVIHNAGLTKTLDKRNFYRINAQNTANLIEALAASGCKPEKFLLMSSLSSYGRGDEKTFRPISLDDPQLPDTDYGKSKLEAENYLRHQSYFPYVILRPTGVYGPGEKDYFMEIKSVKSGFDFAVGFTPQRITFIYVKDLNIYVMSDKLEADKEVTLLLRVMDFNGKVLTKKSIKGEVPANASTLYYKEPYAGMTTSPQNTFLLMTLKNKKGEVLSEEIYYFNHAKDQELPKTEIRYKVKPMDGKYEVTLSARQLARDVFIEIPVQGARFTDNFFDLLPGQTKKVIITSDKLKKNEKVDITIKQLSDTN